MVPRVNAPSFLKGMLQGEAEWDNVKVEWDTVNMGAVDDKSTDCLTSPAGK